MWIYVCNMHARMWPPIIYLALTAWDTAHIYLGRTSNSSIVESMRYSLYWNFMRCGFAPYKGITIRFRIFIAIEYIRCEKNTFSQYNLVAAVSAWALCVCVYKIYEILSITVYSRTICVYMKVDNAITIARKRFVVQYKKRILAY